MTTTQPQPPALVDRALSRLDRHPAVFLAALLIVTGLILGLPVLAVVLA